MAGRGLRGAAVAERSFVHPMAGGMAFVDASTPPPQKKMGCLFCAECRGEMIHWRAVGKMRENRKKKKVQKIAEKLTSRMHTFLLGTSVVFGQKSLLGKKTTKMATNSQKLRLRKKSSSRMQKLSKLEEFLCRNPKKHKPQNKPATFVQISKFRKKN